MANIDLLKDLPPTLLMVSGKDNSVSVASMRALAAGRPNMEIKVYPEAGHAIPFDEPSKFATDVELFALGVFVRTQ
jgi:pimeloyl-ACP methyl ester carboxylesterase